MEESHIEKFFFTGGRKVIKLPADITLSGCEFHRVCASTENDRDSIFVLTLTVN